MQALFQKISLGCLMMALVSANVSPAAEGVTAKIKNVTPTQKQGTATLTPTPPQTPGYVGTVEYLHSPDPHYQWLGFVNEDRTGYFYLETADPSIKAEIQAAYRNHRHVILHGIALYRGAVPYLNVTNIAYVPTKPAPVTPAPKPAPVTPPPAPKPAPVQEPKVPASPKPPKPGQAGKTTRTPGKLPAPANTGTTQAPKTPVTSPTTTPANPPTEVKPTDGDIQDAHGRKPHTQDTANLQGNWEGFQRYLDGKTFAHVTEKPVFVIVDQDAITIDTPRYKVTAEFWVDEFQTPKALDLLDLHGVSHMDVPEIGLHKGDTYDEPKVLAIYKLEGDSLTICLGANPEVRPTSFKVCDKEDGTLVYVRRKRQDGQATKPAQPGNAQPAAGTTATPTTAAPTVKKP